MWTVLTDSGLGLDATIELASDPNKIDGTTATDVDVVIESLYGLPTLSFLKALKPGKPIQYVQVGTVVESTMDVSGDLLSST